MNFHRVAVVTGASAGIGEAVAKTFINEGYKLVVNARREGKLKELFGALKEQVAIVPGDASDSKIIEEILDTAKDRFSQQADIVVVNAGRGLGGSVTTASLNEIDDVIDVNIKGAMRLLQEAGKRMLTDLESNPFPKFPHDIVVLGSTVGRHVSPFSAVYGATKFAVNSLAEAMRREVGPKGIRVSLIEPGIVISEFQSVAGYSDDLVSDFHKRFGPIILPEDVARTIQFIVSQPPHVHVNDVVVRATRQDYP